MSDEVDPDNISLPSNTDQAYVCNDYHIQETPPSPLGFRPQASMETLNIEDSTTGVDEGKRGCCGCFLSLCRGRKKSRKGEEAGLGVVRVEEVPKKA